jgi:hypothetical protein
VSDQPHALNENAAEAPDAENAVAVTNIRPIPTAPNANVALTCAAIDSVAMRIIARTPMMYGKVTMASAAKDSANVSEIKPTLALNDDVAKALEPKNPVAMTDNHIKTTLTLHGSIAPVINPQASVPTSTIALTLTIHDTAATDPAPVSEIGPTLAQNDDTVKASDAKDSVGHAKYQTDPAASLEY